MASLQCNNCKYGIHCTDYPNEIERYAFPIEEWQKLIKTDLPIVRYSLDGPQNYLTIWECPECGAIHIFVADTVLLDQVFIVDSSAGTDCSEAKKYILFDSVHFEPIADSDMTGPEYDGTSHRFFAVKDNVAIIADDENFTENVTYYKQIPIATE
ncbi:MAG: hypothetical protein IK085_09625 [Clostridia bacterium]|nr:hypothetical protein [Clostridia bacterium]